MRSGVEERETQMGRDNTHRDAMHHLTVGGAWARRHQHPAIRLALDQDPKRGVFEAGVFEAGMSEVGAVRLFPKAGLIPKAGPKGWS